MDIDFFKKFNDSYGHQAGDAVLKGVAHILKRNTRATDFVCRYGGEEMSIILPYTDRAEALVHAERICKAVADNKFKLPNIETHFITMNESLYPNHYSDGLLYNNWNTNNRTMNNETYVPKKPKNLTKIKITKKFSNNKQNNILYKDNPIYRMIVSKPKVNTVSLTLKNRKGH